MTTERLCTAPSCTRPWLAKGFCSAHYTRWRKGVDLTAPLGSLYARGQNQCCREGCTEVCVGGGLCSTHYAAERRRDPRRLRCSVSTCSAAAITHGLCNTHYARSLRGLGLDAPIEPRGLTVAEQFARHVQRLGPKDCWPSRSLNPDGYGKFHAEGRKWATHRVAWTLFRGPLARHLHLHHLCRNRACANPAHLEPMTAAAHRALHLKLLHAIP